MAEFFTCVARLYAKGQSSEPASVVVYIINNNNNNNMLAYKAPVCQKTSEAPSRPPDR